MEEWKEIKGYENYFVSNFGNVKHNDKILSQFNNRGYKCVDLYKNNQRKHFRVHKLVYMTFIGEYNCKEKTFTESVRRALNTGSIYYGYSFVRGW